MIAEIVARLKEAAPDLAGVLPAEDIEILSKATAPKSGTAFVLPFRERAEPNQRATGGHLQIVAVQFLVAFVIRQYDTRGGKRALAFDDLKHAIEQALAGWMPPSAEEPLELVGGQATALGNGASIYVQTWQTSRFLEGRTP
ncbi:phage tail terminator protein [Martelella limonii]|uniref:phage tail terminator protein n=1 Tax=Martelella limonii TaxID=1647649 RepID=UPI0015812443